MDLSLFIAKLLGIMYIVMGVGFALQKKHYHKMMKHIAKEEDRLFIFGLAALLIGAVIVLTHQIWSQHWNVLITIFGWLALFKGMSILLFPQKMSKFTLQLMKKDAMVMIAGQACIIIGILFAVAGFAT